MNEKQYYKIESKELCSPKSDILNWQNHDYEYFIPKRQKFEFNSKNGFVFKITPSYRIDEKYFEDFVETLHMESGHDNFCVYFNKELNVIYAVPTYYSEKTLEQLCHLFVLFLPVPKIEYIKTKEQGCYEAQGVCLDNNIPIELVESFGGVYYSDEDPLD